MGGVGLLVACSHLPLSLRTWSCVGSVRSIQVCHGGVMSECGRSQLLDVGGGFGWEKVPVEGEKMCVGGSEE